jgi:hypothetical protein
MYSRLSTILIGLEEPACHCSKSQQQFFYNIKSYLPASPLTFRCQSHCSKYYGPLRRSLPTSESPDSPPSCLWHLTGLSPQLSSPYPSPPELPAVVKYVNIMSCKNASSILQASNLTNWNSGRPPSRNNPFQSSFQVPLWPATCTLTIPSEKKNCLEPAKKLNSVPLIRLAIPKLPASAGGCPIIVTTFRSKVMSEAYKVIFFGLMKGRGILRRILKSSLAFSFPGRISIEEISLDDLRMAQVPNATMKIATMRYTPGTNHGSPGFASYNL